MYNLPLDEVYEKYKARIYGAAHRFSPFVKNNPRISFDDLVGEARLVTARAAQSFDENKGATFLTHLTNALNNELRKYLIEHGYDLSVSEYADRTSYHSGYQDKLRMEANASFHIDENIGGSDDGGLTTIGDIIPSGYPSPEEELIRNESIEVLREEINALPEHERLVINLRYFENKKLREIAEQMDLTKQTIHCWERSAISKLEKRLKVRFGE